MSYRKPSRITPGARQWFRLAPRLLAWSIVLAPLVAHATGYPMFPSLGVSDKPQSKLWYHDNSWWAAVNTLDRIGIFELSGNTWIARDSVGAPAVPVTMGGTTDALFDGTNVYIAAFDSATSRVYKYTYDTPLRDWVPQAGFPVLVPMGTGSETMTLAKDTQGRLWTSYETNFGIVVRHTTTSDMDWSAPDTLATLVHYDDISAIVAFQNKIGVLWSNQNDYAFYFRWRNDTDPLDVWSPPETVVEGVQIADDHISLTVDASGRVFAAMKDQFNHILAARRNLDGTWNANVDVTYGRAATRPIILVDDSESKLYCFYTRWPNDTHIGINWIEYRVANFNTLVFGLETIFIDDPVVSMNNVQSTKQRLSPGSLLAICDAENGMTYWNGWGPISGIGGSGGGGPLPAAPNPPGQPVATTAVAPGGTLGVAAFTLEEGTGSTSADISGRGHTLVFGTATPGDNPEPDWSSGVTGNGLRFNGINDYCQIADPGDLTRTSDFTVECWARPLGDPENLTLISKGVTTARNYRLELTSAGGAEFSMKNTAGSTFTASASGLILDHEWHHIAATYEAGTRLMRLYVDGFLVSTVPFTGTIATSSERVLVGARESTSGLGRYFFGILDQIRISDRLAYVDNFSPPFAFTTQSTKYVKLTWAIPDAQGGIAGYNVFRSINGSPFTKLNGTLLVSANKYNDATAIDGFLTYKVTAVDLLGQESLGSPVLNMEFEGYYPLPPTIPQAYAVTRHLTAGGVVAAYPLDEGGGQAVGDVGGGDFDGTLGATAAVASDDPIWAPGISGSSLEFDGTNDLVRVPDTDALRIPGSMTIECWFKLNQLSRTHALFGKGGSAQRNYRLVVDSNGEIEFSWYTTGGSSRKVLTSSVITDLNWHHVAAVYDAEAGENRIYLDGVLDNTSSASGIPITGDDPLYFGCRKSSSSLKDWLRGRIDLVTVYSGVARTENFSPPATLGSTHGAGYVSLRWTLPEFGLVRGYNVYRSVDGQLDWVLNTTSLWTETAFTDEQPYPGQNCYWVVGVNAQGSEGVPTQVVCLDFAPDQVASDTAPEAARGIELQVAPNPFNPETRVSFHLEHPADVRLALYDVGGRRVRDWLLRAQPAGDHRIALRAEERGSRLASGIYFLELDAAGQQARTRVVLVK